MNSHSATAQAVIAALGLAPHPEGGHYRETWRHRVDATEVWHYYAGAPLALHLSPDGGRVESHRLGPDLAAGERPQVIVPKGVWQSAEPLGAWTLAGCTVSPAFEFEGFELAPADWGSAL
jgi:predicted cupin superfamily sugar epimerase